MQGSWNVVMVWTKKSKYSNKKVEVDGILFHSKKEAKRYVELKQLEVEGEITHLALQPKFELIPKQDGERACYYIADFSYYELAGNTCIVEDTKGFKTADYIIKRKLFKYLYGKQYAFRES